MPRFLVGRLAGLLLTLVAASFLIFSSLYLAPGDPVSTLSGGRTLPPEAVQALRHQYHLEDPFPTRYLSWLGDLVQGDPGESLVFNAKVADLIAARAGTTAMLVAMASVLIVGVGVTLGLVAGIRGGLLDKGILLATVIGQAVPSFVAAIVLIWLFAVQLGWFPAIGSGVGLTGRLQHLTLPAIALALAQLAYVARIARAATREEMGREHVETARARGLAPSQIARRHVVRNAMIPIVTVSGLTVAGLLTTTVVVERVFQLDGVGSLLVEAVVRKDFAVVQAVSLTLVTAFVVVNTVVDLLYGMLDPRVGLGGPA
ncbi:MAG TPA: ABC transporter permease [Propionibacteriaceae bacterium]|nr:ABC transporter permease [Propionibacteriaceae bacterium]